MKFQSDCWKKMPKHRQFLVHPNNHIPMKGAKSRAPHNRKHSTTEKPSSQTLMKGSHVCSYGEFDFDSREELK